MPAPPPKPPPRPGAPAARAAAAKPPPAEDAIARAKREKDELEKETQVIEEELEALKAKYDQYFLGIERREPNRWREELKKKVLRVKGAFTRNTGLRFRIQSLHARFLSYERLWLRSTREKEEGTYRRDLFKARLHRQHGEEEAAPVAPNETSPSAPAAKPADAAAAAPAAPARAAAGAPVPPAKAPAPAPRPAAPPPAAGAMPEAQLRALYNAYVAAKMTCREDVSKLTYDAVARTVSKQIPELLTRYKAKSVEFRVEVKDGKAVLKAIPKV